MTTAPTLNGEQNALPYQQSVDLTTNASTLHSLFPSVLLD